jgi:hypothetical protein
MGFTRATRRNIPEDTILQNICEEMKEIRTEGMLAAIQFGILHLPL